jgi:hypothetical protein
MKHENLPLPPFGKGEMGDFHINLDKAKSVEGES